jgi:hypothetical protein
MAAAVGELKKPDLQEVESMACIGLNDICSQHAQPERYMAGLLLA